MCAHGAGEREGGRGGDRFKGKVQRACSVIFLRLGLERHSRRLQKREDKKREGKKRINYAQRGNFEKKGKARKEEQRLLMEEWAWKQS